MAELWKNLHSKRIQQAFHFADRDGKGYLNRQEYKIAMTSLIGHKPYKWEVDEVYNTYHPEKQVTLPEFRVRAIKKLKYHDGNHYTRELFYALDHDCKGFLVLEDFQLVQVQALPHLPAWLTNEIFHQADHDMDGRIGYKEFHSFITNISHTET